MAKQTGYQINFMGVSVPFPQLSAGQLKDLARTDEKKTGELKYPHFSVFLSSSRCFPFFTATNIDGKLFKKIPRKEVFPSGNDEWSLDERAADFQWGAHLYSAQKSDFQRGHMTKREDPQWGETVEIAREAAQATFRFANCVPQMGELNTEDWGKLETYILTKQSVPEKLKVSVFTGPVLSANDPVFVTEVDGYEVQIPTLFWKIVYYLDETGTLSRAGFLMGQENALFEKKIVVRRTKAAIAEAADFSVSYFQDFEDAAIYQVNISTIEKLSKLKFPPALEPYHDDRPLKLVVDKVQVGPHIAAISDQEALNMDENETFRFQFSNMKTIALPNAATTAPAGVATAAGIAGTVSASAAGPAGQYTGEMRKHFGYHATWLPNTPLALGDVGIMKGDVFIKVSDLAARGVSFQKGFPETNPKPADIDYSSKGAVSMTTKLAGKAAPVGSALTDVDAGVIIEFSKENAIIFQANGTLVHAIEDTLEVGAQIIELFKAGKWDKNWVVITELVSAESETLLIASGKNMKVELKANANISAASLNIADTQFGFTLQGSSSLQTKIVASQGLTPLFRLMKLRSQLFSPLEFSIAGVSPLDMLTPEDASDPANNGKIQFNYLEEYNRS
ncbi:DNA/RNA non-specific endonuclease [Filimonas effusa]|uniref:DNA/RNA non-specific endonuclease n=1 Tax=Filimonas effusa TaxID=2508721 RepID=A0A4Q1DCL7_9BACT|nr:DNA/RNA non-specific endonuclease [Filimonas effusa]RXK86373.1 hypothetical protein ESB13_06090 [Filimonas effusa]